MKQLIYIQNYTIKQNLGEMKSIKAKTILMQEFKKEKKQKRKKTEKKKLCCF